MRLPWLKISLIFGILISSCGMQPSDVPGQAIPTPTFFQPLPENDAVSPFA
jgi:hypothetical protein